MSAQPRELEDAAEDVTSPVLSLLEQWYPLLVLFVSVLLLLLALFVFHRDRPAEPWGKTWEAFWMQWGPPVGVAYTVLLAVLVSLLPSRFEKRVEEMRKRVVRQLRYLEDRIQSPISSFSEVVARAEILLDQLGDRPNTEFMVVSASPILGLELEDAKRDQWRRLLERRIQTNDKSCKTSIVCLDPNGTATSVQSQLGEFCKVLAESESLSVRASYKELFNRGRRGTEEFQTRYSKKPNFRLRFGDDPPFQVIIARDEKGFRKAILYLSSTGTLRRRLRPQGFYTEERGMGDVLEDVFRYVWESAADAPEDPRTPLQRDRDFDLQLESASAKRSEDLELDYPQIAPGFKLLVKKGVFPPDLALAADDFPDAIEQAANLVWDHVLVEDRIGIDVGTGTGVLALLLAKHCRTVFATDVGEVEVANAEHNFANYKAARVKVRQGSLLDKIDPAEAGKFPLIVFNHPYYPSPSNVFNVGGPKAGQACIEEFLKQAEAFLVEGGGVLMPSADMADKHDPVKLAIRMGYDAKLVGSKRTNAQYGDHYIYLFRWLADRKADQPSGAPAP